jgi:response regulator of citrate/malate metabolism
MCSSESDRKKISEIISLKITDYILKPIAIEDAIRKFGKIFPEVL